LKLYLAYILRALLFGHLGLLLSSTLCFSQVSDPKDMDSIAMEMMFRKEKLISTNGCEMPYRILLPASYEKKKKYPLVLFLHGGGERGTDNSSQLAHGAALFVSEENRRKFPCIAVFPQCPKESYWSSAKIDRSTRPVTFEYNYENKITIGLEAALEVLNHCLKTEQVDTRRVYIVGLSMGGMGTLETLHRKVNQFAAAVAICGGGDTLRFTPAIKNFPIRIYHGSDDDVVSVQHSRGMSKKLKSLGAQVSYIEYPGVMHNSWDLVFKENDLLSWLFSQKRL
jgi:predicted peptidase